MGNQEVKHTPGPWTAHRTPSGFSISGVRLLALLPVTASSKKIVGQQPANAHLIAAAPELLEALEGLLADISEYQAINNLSGEKNYWQVKARTAIAKATAE